MNLQNVIPENAYAQLSLLAGRLRQKVEDLKEQIPLISTIGNIFIRNAEEDVEYATEELSQLEIQDLSQSVHTLFDEGKTLIDSSDNLVLLQSSINEETGKLELFLMDWADDQVTATKDELLMSIDSTRNAVSIIGAAKLATIKDKIFNNDFSNLFAMNFGELYSESCLWLDTISSFLSNSWSDVSGFVNTVWSKVQGGSSSLISVFNSIKDKIQAVDPSNLLGMAQSLLEKFNISATIHKRNNTSITYDNEGIWEITSINKLVAKNVLAKVSSFVGQVLAFVGGAVVKVVGLAMQGVSKLADMSVDEIKTLGQIKVNEKGFLSAWYGNVLDFTVNQSLINFDPVGLDNLPYVLDFGYMKLMATPLNEEVSGEAIAKVKYRAYQPALIDPDRFSALVTIIKGWGVGTQNFYPCGLYVNDNGIGMSQIYGQLSEWYNSSTLNTDEFESLTDEEKLVSYALSLWLVTFTLCSSFGTSSVARYIYTFTSRISSGTTKYTEEEMRARWQQVFNGTFVFGNQYSNPLGLATRTIPGDVITAAILYLYDHYDQIIDDMDWTFFISFKNAVNEWFNDPEDPYVDDIDFLVGYAPGHNQYITSYVSSPQGPEYEYDDIYFGWRFAYYDYNLNQDYYRYNWALAANSTCAVRYYPPSVDPASISAFVTSMTIAIAVAAVITTAVFMYGKVTRNTRQAKKYAEYDKARQAYNSNPSKANFKAVKKTRKSLMWDTKLYGSSKYLSTLSAAQFGWDSSDSSTPDGSLLQPTEAPMDVDMIYIKQMLEFICDIISAHTYTDAMTVPENTR